MGSNSKSHAVPRLDDVVVVSWGSVGGSVGSAVAGRLGDGDGAGVDARRPPVVGGAGVVRGLVLAAVLGTTVAVGGRAEVVAAGEVAGTRGGGAGAGEVAAGVDAWRPPVVGGVAARDVGGTTLVGELAEAVALLWVVLIAPVAGRVDGAGLVKGTDVRSGVAVVAAPALVGV